MHSIIFHASCATAPGRQDTSTTFDIPQSALIIVMLVGIAIIVGTAVYFTRRGR